MAASKVQLLLAAVWVAFALAASQVAAHSLEISKTNPVCIIGAGPAGISAATALRQAEIPLVVIEGRARPGGRIWSSAALGKGVNGNEPVTIDLGAGWLEGDGAGSPVYNVVKPFLTDAHTVVSDFDQGEQYYVEGGEVTVDPMAGWTAVEDKIEAEQAAGDDVDPTLATLLARAEAGMTAGNKLKTEWQATVNIIDEWVSFVGRG